MSNKLLFKLGEIGVREFLIGLVWFILLLWAFNKLIKSNILFCWFGVWLTFTWLLFGMSNILVLLFKEKLNLKIMIVESILKIS